MKSPQPEAMTGVAIRVTKVPVKTFRDSSSTQRAFAKSAEDAVPPGLFRSITRADATWFEVMVSLEHALD